MNGNGGGGRGKRGGGSGKAGGPITSWW